MIFKEKEIYLIIFAIAITLVSVTLHINSSAYASYDRYTLEQSTIIHGLAEQKNNSNIKDLKTPQPASLNNPSVSKAILRSFIEIFSQAMRE